jgi:branched-chain amino acid transport system substrate-binding protein
MCPKTSLWYKFIAVALALVLIVPILAACGKEKEKTPAPTPTPTATPGPTLTATPGQTSTAMPSATASPTSTTAVTPTPVLTGPVKIGGITSWSGSAAISGIALADPIIKLVEKQVKDMGGILGGRELKVVKYDNRASVAEAVAGARKLVEDDKVSALVWGGISGAEVRAVTDFAEENKVLFVAFQLRKGYYEGQFSVSAAPTIQVFAEQWVSFATKVLKPKTVAFLGFDLTDSHDRIGDCKPGFEAAGIKTVYEEYCPLDTQDFMPYLTKIKYANPGVLIVDVTSSEAAITIAKQIMELGGWGDIKVLTNPAGDAAKAQAGAQGWYVLEMWYPELSYPGSVKFKQDYQAMFGRLPSSNQVYFYDSLWTAIYAIELAGTDTDLAAIAQAARSGNLEWETPMGRARFSTDGFPNVNLSLVQIQEGKLVPVTMPE